LSLPDESYSVRKFKVDNSEITFEKSEEALCRITLNRNGMMFVADDLPKELYRIFLSRITKGKIVETIEDLIVLLS
jgi:hypothetical protein